MPEANDRASAADVLFLAALSLFFMLYGLGRGSLASWDEAIYASVAKDVLKSGDWLRLTLAGDPWFDKPPLAIWATALFQKALGVNELSSRLFSALCGAGAVLATYFAGLRLFGRWTGLLGALVLLNSSHFLRFSRFGQMEGPLVLFLTLALLWFWRGRTSNRYYVWSGVALGFAFLVKGFAAFFFVPVVALYALLARDASFAGRSSFWVGLMVAVGIALPWNVYEMAAHRDAFLSNVVVKHLLTRTMNPIEGHDGNWYFYVRTFINKYHPWVLVGIFSAPYFLWRAARRGKPEFALVAAWAFGVFVVITLVRTKLPWYLMPAYPAVSITVGYWLARWIDAKRRPLVMALFAAGMWLHVPLSHLTEADYSRDVKAIAPAVRAHVGEGRLVYLYKYHEQPATVFYWERPSRYADDPKAFAEAAAAQGPRFRAFARERDMGELAPLLERFGLIVAASAGEGRLLVAGDAR